MLTYSYCWNLKRADKRLIHQCYKIDICVKPAFFQVIKYLFFSEWFLFSWREFKDVKKVYRSNILWTENVRQFLVLYHMCLWLTLISFITRTLFALSPLNKQKLNFLIDYIQSQSFLTGFLSLDSTWIFSIPKTIFCKLQFWWYKYLENWK